MLHAEVPPGGGAITPTVWSYVNLSKVDYNQIKVWINDEGGSGLVTLPNAKTRITLHFRKKLQATSREAAMCACPLSSVAESPVFDAEILHATNTMDPLFTAKHADRFIEANRLSTFAFERRHFGQMILKTNKTSVNKKIYCVISLNYKRERISALVTVVPKWINNRINSMYMFYSFIVVRLERVEVVQTNMKNVVFLTVHETAPTMNASPRCLLARPHSECMLCNTQAI